jgi:hypothetical protein
VNIPVYCLTSNAYVHALCGFAYCWEKYWPGQPVTIVRYDVRPPALGPLFTNVAIGRQADYAWSDGVIEWLTRICKDDVFVLVLEDYWLCRVPNIGCIEVAYNSVLNGNAVKWDLSGDRARYPHIRCDEYDASIIQSTDTARFQASLQAAVWRRGFFLEALMPGETPWQFERNGTRRIIAWRRDFGGRIIKGYLHDEPLRYINAIGGEGTMPNVYARKRFHPDMWAELEREGFVHG